MQDLTLEILYHIFSFSSGEDLDIGLFLTSKSMAQKLAGHHLIRLIQIFLTRHELLTLYPEDEMIRDGASPAALACLLDETDDRERPGSCLAIWAVWCNERFVKAAQLAAIKRLLMTYWDPLLLRDRQPISKISHADLWRRLEGAGSEKQPATTDELLMSRADAVDGRYSWVRIIIWPDSGRISVRDQLYNQRFVISIPLMPAFLTWKKQWAAKEAFSLVLV